MKKGPVQTDRTPFESLYFEKSYANSEKYLMVRTI